MIHNVLSLGAGVQSSTLALMAEKGQVIIEGQVWKPDCAIFADTQNEPKEVYNWLAYLITQLSFPVHIVTKGNLGTDGLKIKYHSKTGERLLDSKIPMFTQGEKSVGMLQRRCTRDYKIRPIIQKLRALFNPQQYREAHRLLIDPGLPYQKGNVYWTIEYPNFQILQWVGISVDEASRMKPSSEKWITNKWPLIEMGMSRQDCLKWMQNNGYEKPPRSACYFCPYHSDLEWRHLKEFDPESFQLAVDLELETQEVYEIAGNIKQKPFFHRSCKPLSEVEFTANSRVNNFENECEGMCGV